MSTPLVDVITPAGVVQWTLVNADGTVAASGASSNLITQIGDQLYGERAAGLAGAPAVITGMKLGTGATAASKTGAGAALVTYLANSHQALLGVPASALFTDTLDGNKVKRQITYSATYAAGKATTAVAITEIVMVNTALTDATSAASATICRAVLSPAIASKASDQVLTATWLHNVYGA